VVGVFRYFSRGAADGIGVKYMTKRPVKKSKANTASKSAAEVEARREAFRRWLDLTGVNANEAAKAAGFSVSAIYNFLNGDTKSLSSTILSKLSLAYKCSVDSIMGGRAEITNVIIAPIKILYRVGARGSMFVCEDNLVAAPPAGAALPSGVSAAVVDGDGLAPIPDGWVVYFRDEASEPDRLEGKMATVRYSGGGDRPVVRVILRSQFEGLWTLKALDGSLTEDVKIVAAHEIVAFGQSQISEA